ncbi:MAG: di-trans,poly-cis-decaprenylcistransferase [Dehalococcoidia bacterium]|nr:di-trans,poly-cis-decaprenylcistransferase [Dehalococcoidia bacterium]
MDGNGRWAESREMSRSEGHRAGVANIRRTITAFAKAGVEYLTLYAFSTENWGRPIAEVDALISIMLDVIGPESENLHEQGVRIKHIGSLNRLPQNLRDAIINTIEMTKHNDRLTLCVAFNYGSRTEILDAVRKMLADGVASESVDESLFATYLDTAGIPDPDLIIRTAGEMRLSNFLLWQAAYSEFYCTSALWPDFDELEVEKALQSYARRERRFGRLDG